MHLLHAKENFQFIFQPTTTLLGKTFYWSCYVYSAWVPSTVCLSFFIHWSVANKMRRRPQKGNAGSHKKSQSHTIIIIFHFAHLPQIFAFFLHTITSPGKIIIIDTPLMSTLFFNRTNRLLRNTEYAKSLFTSLFERGCVFLYCDSIKHTSCGVQDKKKHEFYYPDKWHHKRL